MEFQIRAPWLWAFALINSFKYISRNTHTQKSKQNERQRFVSLWKKLRHGQTQYKQLLAMQCHYHSLIHIFSEILELHGSFFFKELELWTFGGIVLHTWGSFLCQCAPSSRMICFLMFLFIDIPDTKCWLLHVWILNRAMFKKQDWMFQFIVWQYVRIARLHDSMSLNRKACYPTTFSHTNPFAISEI